MKAPRLFAAAMLALAASTLTAQEVGAPSLGEVMVTSGRQNARFAQPDRPVIGLRRQADGALMTITISSDTRDEATRKQEIHTVLLGAIDRAAAAGFKLVSGQFQLSEITRANYKDLQFYPAGRVDTSKVELLVRAPLDGSAGATQAKLAAFAKSLKGSGRATIENDSHIILTVINPDQYREEIIKLVAEDARRTAALFGPEFSFNISGIDGQVAWSQVSPTEVLLYIPYRYTVIPK